MFLKRINLCKKRLTKHSDPCNMFIQLPRATHTGKHDMHIVIFKNKCSETLATPQSIETSGEAEDFANSRCAFQSH